MILFHKFQLVNDRHRVMAHRLVLEVCVCSLSFFRFFDFVSIYRRKKDTIGCGWRRSTRELYYTYNGNTLDIIISSFRFGFVVDQKTIQFQVSSWVLRLVMSIYHHLRHSQTP